MNTKAEKLVQKRIYALTCKMNVQNSLKPFYRDVYFLNGRYQAKVYAVNKGNLIESGYMRKTKDEAAIDAQHIRDKHGMKVAYRNQESEKVTEYREKISKLKNMIVDVSRVIKLNDDLLNKFVGIIKQPEENDFNVMDMVEHIDVIPQIRRRKGTPKPIIENEPKGYKPNKTISTILTSANEEGRSYFEPNTVGAHSLRGLAITFDFNAMTIPDDIKDISEKTTKNVSGYKNISINRQGKYVATIKVDKGNYKISSNIAPSLEHALTAIHWMRQNIEKLNNLTLKNKGPGRTETDDLQLQSEGG